MSARKDNTGSIVPLRRMPAPERLSTRSSAMSSRRHPWVRASDPSSSWQSTSEEAFWIWWNRGMGRLHDRLSHADQLRLTQRWDEIDRSRIASKTLPYPGPPNHGMSEPGIPGPIQRSVVAFRTPTATTPTRDTATRRSARPSSRIWWPWPSSAISPGRSRSCTRSFRAS